jgi:hypothetical protein
MAGMTKPALAVLSLAVLALTAGAARGDVPPQCAAQDALITCAAADVGKPCQGGGQCYEISCANGYMTGSKVYKCDACPTVVPSSNECAPSKFGQPCGADGGTATCGYIPFHCQNGKYECQTPATAKPTGPPSSGAAGTDGGAAGTGDGTAGTGAAGTGAAGTGAAGTGTAGTGTAGTGAAGTGGGSTSSGGCDVVPSPSDPTVIGLGLLVVGGVLFLVSWLRRRSRRSQSKAADHPAVR